MIKLTSSKHPDYYMEVADDGRLSTTLLNRVLEAPQPELVEAGQLRPVLLEAKHPYAIWFLAYMPFAARFKKDALIPDVAYWANIAHESIAPTGSSQDEGGVTSSLSKDEALTATRFVVMDVETTGLTDKDEVIQLSAVRFENGEITGEFDQLIQPSDISKVSQLITDITGIEQSDLVDQPRFSEVIDSFLEFVGDDIWVGHNISFDLRMIGHELKRLERPMPSLSSIDTLTLTKQCYPFWPSRGGTFKLENLKLRLAPELIENLSSHNALDDSKMCGYWLLHLQKEVG